VTTLVDRVAQTILDTGLLGCGCCVEGVDYDKDGCPPNPEGDLGAEHTYEGRCIHHVGRAAYIAKAILLDLGFCPVDGDSMPCLTCGAGL